MALDAALSQPLRSALGAISPERVTFAYLHCLVGTAVATRGEVGAVAGSSLCHLAWAVLLVGGAAIFRGDHRIYRALGLTAMLLGVLVSLGAPSRFLLLYSLASVAVLAVSRRHVLECVPEIHSLSWGITFGVLPFLAGYLASGHRLGSSTFLLSIAFFGIFAGFDPLLPAGSLLPKELHQARKHPTRRWRLMLTASLLLGLGALFAWLWIYGPGLSGIALAIPSVLWLLWLMASWTLGDEHPHSASLGWRQAFLPWAALELAIGVSSAL